MTANPQCKLCTGEEYERIAETAHFVALVRADKALGPNATFIVPKAHIELRELHELFAAELWGLLRHVVDGRSFWLSGTDAGSTLTEPGHGYIAISVITDAAERAA